MYIVDEMFVMKTLFTMVLLLFVGISLHAQAGFSSLGEKEDFVQELNVFPNPSTDGIISLRFLASEKQDVITIKVYNLIGKEVYTHQLQSHEGEFQETISLSSSPKGVYILEVSNGDQKQIRRLSYI